MENIMHHFVPEVLLELRVGNIDLSITNYVVWLFVAFGITFLTFFIAAKRAALVPRGAFQNAVEELIEFVRNEMVVGVIGKEGEAYFSFIATLFFFILVSNLIGLIPNSKTPTSLVGTTGAWAVLVFFLYHWVGVRKHGVWRYIKSFVPSGVPLWLVPFMFVIEVISHFFRPFSLAVRLFANMLAGHTVLAVFTLMAVTSSWWVKAIPFSGIVVMYAFEIFVAFIQAYIFAILAAIYIDGALHVH